MKKFNYYLPSHIGENVITFKENIEKANKRNEVNYYYDELYPTDYEWYVRTYEGVVIGIATDREDNITGFEVCNFVEPEERR